jgi:serine/threonine-protein kinase
MDRRSDVFSLGVVLWEMLAQRQLFDGDSIYAVAFAVEQKEIAPPSQVIGAALPAGLDAVVMGALDRDVSRRTPTAAALADQLDEVVQAAGGDTLEAWTERELAARRDRHRAWLAEVVGGKAALPRAAGRPTGLHTEVAAAAPGHAQTALAPVDDAGDDELVVPRRSLALPAIALLLVLAAGGIAVYFATRAPAVVAPPRDAAPAVAAAVTPPPIADAAVRAVPLPDAAPVVEPPRDAGVHHVVHVPRDAGAHVAAIVPIDAAAIQPSGNAILFAKHGDHFLNISMDGRQLGNTPILGKGRTIPAGRHHFQLTEPTDGTVVVDKTVDLRDGDSFTLQP